MLSDAAQIVAAVALRVGMVWTAEARGLRPLTAMRTPATLVVVVWLIVLPVLVGPRAVDALDANDRHDVVRVLLIVGWAVSGSSRS